MASPRKARICVPVCEHTVAQTQLAIERAASVGDLIELRLDCLDPSEVDRSFSNIGSLLSDGHQFVVTYRPAEQGGRREVDVASRLVFWMFNYPSDAQLLDIELDLCSGYSLFDEYSRARDWERVICSYHDFVGIPTDLQDVYKRMMTTPAGILKIAVRADDVVDCLPLFKLLETARAEGREMIAIAMGSAGLLTRILGPSRGGFFTYGALDTDNATAPGQITARELRDTYHLDSLNLKTQITGLVGLPVSHSVSPHMHNAGFATSGFDGVYVPFEVHDLNAFFRRMVHPRTRELDWNLRGLSVTAPYKTAVLEYLDWIEPDAKEVGAVNTILIDGNGVQGFNFDAVALAQSLSERMGELHGLSCAVIGTGGVAQAAIYALSKRGAKLTVFAREVDKARVLAKKFDSAYESLKAANFEAFDVVINATPLGTAGTLQQETPATAAQLRGARLAYDLVYNPPETQFICEARAAGCQTQSGLSMLINQAGAQFSLWTGMEPPLAAMQAAALKALS